MLRDLLVDIIKACVPDELETTAAEGGEMANQSIVQDLSPPVGTTVATPEPPAPAAVI